MLDELRLAIHEEGCNLQKAQKAYAADADADADADEGDGEGKVVAADDGESKGDGEGKGEGEGGATGAATAADDDSEEGEPWWVHHRPERVASLQATDRELRGATGARERLSHLFSHLREWGSAQARRQSDAEA